MPIALREMDCREGAKEREGREEYKSVAAFLRDLRAFATRFSSL
jgi:hypothetical protein